MWADDDQSLLVAFQLFSKILTEDSESWTYLIAVQFCSDERAGPIRHIFGIGKSAPLGDFWRQGTHVPL